MGNGEEKNDLIKDLTALGTAQLKKHIFLAVLPILPYILLGLVIILIVCLLLFGIMSQANDVISSANDIGERVGNAFSLYGFRTEAEVEQTEEVRFYSRIDLYKNLFPELTTYDWVLGIKTLLYEGNYSEKKYLASSSDPGSGTNNFIDKALDGNLKVSDFFKDVGISFSQGFHNSFMGNSKYKKANKNLIEVVEAMSKCHRLTDANGTITADYRKCYEGYLLAEFTYDYDAAIEAGEVEPEVEVGHLVFNIPDLDSLDIGSGQSFTANALGFAALATKFESYLSSFVFGPLGLVFSSGIERIKLPLKILLFGRVAGDENPTLGDLIKNPKEVFTTIKTDHFYYDGYIVRYLKEYYKLENVYHDGAVDKAKLEQERYNKKEIAAEIFDSLYEYCKYGDNICDIEGLVTGTAVAASGNAEAQSSVTVTINGEETTLSFNDYVILYATNIYGDELKKALEANNTEKVLAILMMAKQNVYAEFGGLNLSNPSLKSNKKFDDTVYNTLTANEKELLKRTIESYLGKALRNDGKISTLTNAQVKAVLMAVDNGLSYEDALKSVLGESYSYSSGFQMPLSASYSISTGYNEGRWGEKHKGIDFAAAGGSTIYSISDGIVVNVQTGCPRGSYGDTCGGGFGNRVYVAYNNGDGHTYYVIYAHMLSVNVHQGDTVSAGSVLGAVGSSGSSTGDHLHLEIRVDSTDKGAQTMNPSSFFGLQL